MTTMMEAISACCAWIARCSVVNWSDVQRRFPRIARERLQAQFIRRLCARRDRTRKYHFWGAAETQILVEAVQRHGREWQTICDSLFPRFTATKLRNRYYALLRSGGLGEFARMSQDERYFDRFGDFDCQGAGGAIDLIAFLMQ